MTVTIPSGGSIMGGWQADPSTVGPTYGLPAAGIILNSTGGTATLTPIARSRRMNASP